MKVWKNALMGLCLLTAAAITWLFNRIFMDVIATTWIVLAAILLLVLMAAFFTWVRRMPRDARKRGIRQGLFAGLLSGSSVLIYAWRQGQLPDALRFLPIMLVVSGVVLLPPGLLAWQMSTLILSRTGAEASQRSGRAGRWLAATVAATLLLFCLGPWAQSLSALDLARSTRMKSRCRGIWAAVLSGSMERDARGLPALWPRELGFTGTESSTAYFRRLLSDEAGGITEDADRRLASDLDFWALAGPGLREATSAAAFAAENNAWQVVCIGSNAPGWAPWLISRNVDFGDWLTPTSQPRFIRSGPLNLRRVVWVSCGGGIFDARFKTFRTEMLFDSWGGWQNPAATSLVYRIMRP